MHSAQDAEDICQTVFLKLLTGGQIRRLLFAATGALMSPTASMQGQSIPGICHAVAIETQVNA